MSQRKNTTIRAKGQHLDYPTRKIIEVMLKKGFKRKEIAQSVQISQSTLSTEIRRGEIQTVRIVRERELKRNYYHGKETIVAEWSYSAKAAQADADSKKENSVKHFSILKESEYVNFVESLIISNPKKYSPDVANEEARKRGYKCVSTKTLYNWIEWGLLKIKPLDLLRKVGRKKSTKIEQQKRKYGKSIEERPKEVENREEFGHWEGDSMVGADHKGQIISLVDRKHRIGLMFKFDKMRAENMVTVLKRLKKMYGDEFTKIFKSITFDNGSEFAYNKKMSRYTNIYYAHAYSSWERGTNENFNGIVRRYIPKGSDITKLKQADIERIQNSINTMPRKILGYKTPLEAFSKELVSA